MQWLLGEGFTHEEIERSITPIYLPAARAVGDDGTRLTVDEAVARSGLPLDLLMAFARAAGIPAFDDPTARSQIAADVDVAAHAKEFLELGLPAEQMLAVTRVMAHGLSQAAEVMRQAALDAVLQPGATELQLAQSYGALVEVLAPKLGPMVHDLLLIQLRHSFETEAINASERAAGQLPGARDVGVAFADIVGFTRLGETLEPAQLEEVARELADRARAVRSRRCASSRRSAMPSCSSPPTSTRWSKRCSPQRRATTHRRRLRARRQPSRRRFGAPVTSRVV